MEGPTFVHEFGVATYAQLHEYVSCRTFNKFKCEQQFQSNDFMGVSLRFDSFLSMEYLKAYVVWIYSNEFQTFLKMNFKWPGEVAIMWRLSRSWWPLPVSVASVLGHLNVEQIEPHIKFHVWILRIGRFPEASLATAPLGHTTCHLRSSHNIVSCHKGDCSSQSHAASSKILQQTQRSLD